MKIIGIVGSPRGLKGSTGRLMMGVLAGAEGKGATVETASLPGGTVAPCRACDMCHKKGECPQKDEFNALKERVLASDGVVLASPNYIFSVSAQLKAFMDRCCGVIHRVEFDGRYGASVVTSGGGDEEPIADFMNHYMVTTGIRPVGAVWATMGSIRGGEFPEEVRRQARALGEKLVDAWENKSTAPDVEKTRAAFIERMRRLMVWRKEEWPFEYEYWRKNRGLEA